MILRSFLFRALPVVAACLVLVVAACGGGGGGGNSVNLSALSGAITWSKDGDLWVMTLPGRQEQKLTNLPQGAAVTGAVWSPDGASIAFAQFWRRPGDKTGGADLFAVGQDGSNSRLLAERDAASTILETPFWARDGRVYYGVRRLQGTQDVVSIMRQVEGGPAETVQDRGFNPAVSPDNSTLVYEVTTGAAQALWKRSLTGGSDACVLLPDTVFQSLGLPRISPDGQHIVFPAIGDPAKAPGTCGSAASGAPESAPMSPLLQLASLLQPETAWAHGLPWDIWVIGIDGSGLKKVADVKEDEPNVTWSPDGQTIGIFGATALYVVPADGGQVQKLLTQGGYAGLDWKR